MTASEEPIYTFAQIVAMQLQAAGLEPRVADLLARNIYDLALTMNGTKPLPAWMGGE